MLRKRARSNQKSQEMGQITSDDGSKTNSQPDISGQNQKTSSLFIVPGLLVGLAPKCFLDYDSVRSPTSPLDFKLFPNLGSSFRFPKPNHDSHQKCWECDKVGLSIVDSLGHVDIGDDTDGVKGKSMKSSNSKNILFGPQIRIKTSNASSHLKISELPKSLPKNCPVFTPAQIKSSNIQKGKSDVLFEIGEDTLEPDPYSKIQSFSLDSKRIGSCIHHLAGHRAGFGTKSSCLANRSVEVNSDFEKLSASNLDSVDVTNGSSSRFLGSLSASEIELSEDYTCVITHGPNPKTTHIFGDCILEGHTSSRADFGNKGEDMESNGIPIDQKSLEFIRPFPENDFLSFCYFCNKKLEEGKDIFMYRGEKAFCSLDCRLEEILIEEGKEKSIKEAPNESPES